MAVAGLHRLEQGRAQRRRQRQRQQRREADRRDHGHRELAIDDADRARKERHRHEYRHQHQRDADDSARDLRHRLARRLLRRQAFLGHDALDVLDHDDGVVDEDADREHHAEHGEHVDGIAGQHQRGAGAEQRHRHHDGRNDGVADVLQEQKHHHEDKYHRLDERRQHLLDRGFHDRRDVVGDFVGDIGREEARQLLHLGFHRIGSRQRVAGRRQQHRKARGRLAVEAGVELVAQTPDLDPRDIAQPHRRAVGVGAQDDRAELVRRIELAFHQHQGRRALLGRSRLGADAAGGDLRVLRRYRLVDIVCRQSVADEFGRLEPDAKRTLGRIQRRAADAGNAPDFTEDVADHEVAEADLVEAAVGRGQRDDLQHRAGGLLDEDAFLDDGGGKPRLDALEAVLHIDRGLIGVGARHEVGGDLDLAKQVAGRFEIEDAGGAVQLLLDQARDAIVEIFRRGARILRRDRDRGRRDDWILRHGQQRNRDRADQTDEQRDNPGEDRPVDEEARHRTLTAGLSLMPTRPDRPIRRLRPISAA